MPETYDITLGAAGYMLAPGTYHRQQAGPVPTPAAHRVTRARWSGALQAIAARPERYWSGYGLRPVLDGQGVGPGPLELAPLAIAGFDLANPRFAVLAGGRPYVAAGDGLWRLDRASGANPYNLGGATQLGGPLGAVAAGLAMSGDRYLVVARQGLATWVYDLVTATWSTWPLALNNVAVYGNAVWGLGSVTEPYRLIHVIDGPAGTINATGWYLGATLRGAALVRDALYVATTNALWRVKGYDTGNNWSGTMDTIVYAHGAGYNDSFTSLVDFNGELFTWYAGQVHRYDASATVGGALVPVGLHAGACRGLTVAGDLLIAAVVDTPQYAGAQVWAFDGRGWFCLARNPGGGLDYAYPFPTASYFQDADVILSNLGTTQLTGYQLRSYPAQPGLAPAGELLTGQLDDGAPDTLKTWLRVGAELFAPAPSPAPSSCTVTLSYSLDGRTYTVAGSATVSTAAATSLVFDLPAAARAKALGLAFAVSGVSSGGPVLGALWAEYRPTPLAVPKRSWSFEILASDDVTTRAGGGDARTGRQLAATLWSAWAAAAPLTFRDVDYDLDPTPRTVRITHLAETAKTTSDAGRWTEARLKVALVEE